MAVTVDTGLARGLAHADVAGASLAHRARAFADAKRHSRVVRLLRAALPLAALGVLAVYVIVLAVSWQLVTGRLRVGSVEITADDLIMKDPSYFGVTSDGGHYQVRAKRAVVGFNQNAPIKLIDVGGDLVATDKATTKLKAKHGLFDNAKGELELFDGIEIDNTNGMMASLSRATIYSKESRVVSKHPVSANTPTGSVQASAMTLLTKARLAEFRGSVSVRMLPSAQSAIGTGRDARQPLNVYAEELDVDDAQKTAHFRTKVVAMQGETMLSTPYLFVKYEGKAADALGPAAQAQGQAETQGSRVTFLWARSGVEITAGTDRRIPSELADFDVVADTALFVGNVVVTQDKNLLRGGRLFVERKVGRSRLETPALGSQPAGRITAKFHQSAGASAQPSRPKGGTDAAQDGIFGSFKSDPNAPMDVEANTLEMLDASKKAIFSGNVKAQQGDLVIRTAELTAFYSGQAGFGTTDAAADAAAKGQVERIEARRKVLITSKDNQNATAEWANFDVKSNTALLGGGVVVVRGKEIAEGPTLKINLTTGTYRFEGEAEAPAAVPAVKPPSISASPPATSSSSANTAEGRACPPGKQCVLIYPKDAKEKAQELLKKNAPGLKVPELEGPAVR
jgi:lipopolysaccharide transport protein LptA